MSILSSQCAEITGHPCDAIKDHATFLDRGIALQFYDLAGKGCDFTPLLDYLPNNFRRRRAVLERVAQ